MSVRFTSSGPGLGNLWPQDHKQSSRFLSVVFRLISRLICLSHRVIPINAFFGSYFINLFNFFKTKVFVIPKGIIHFKTSKLTGIITTNISICQETFL